MAFLTLWLFSFLQPDFLLVLGLYSLLSTGTQATLSSPKLPWNFTFSPSLTEQFSFPHPTTKPDSQNPSVISRKQNNLPRKPTRSYRLLWQIVPAVYPIFTFFLSLWRGSWVLFGQECAQLQSYISQPPLQLEWSMWPHQTDPSPTAMVRTIDPTSTSMNQLG